MCPLDFGILNNQERNFILFFHQHCILQEIRRMRRCTKLALGRTVALLAVWVLLMCSLNLDISSFDNENWNGEGPCAELCRWNGVTGTVDKGLQYQTILIFLFCMLRRQIMDMVKAF